MTVYLHLFHGRDTPEEKMEDWGFDGPTLGPFEYIHITYMCDLKFSMPEQQYREQFPRLPSHPYEGMCEGYIVPVEGLIEYDGKFYGDFSITSSPQE